MENINIDILREMRLGLSRTEYVKRLDYLIGYNDGDSQTKKRKMNFRDAIYEFIKAKKHGASKRDLTRRFQTISRLTKEEILASLEANGLIEKTYEKNLHGPATILYSIIKI